MLKVRDLRKTFSAVDSWNAASVSERQRQHIYELAVTVIREYLERLTDSPNCPIEVLFDDRAVHGSAVLPAVTVRSLVAINDMLRYLDEQTFGSLPGQRHLATTAENNRVATIEGWVIDNGDELYIDSVNGHVPAENLLKAAAGYYIIAEITKIVD